MAMGTLKMQGQEELQILPKSESTTVGYLDRFLCGSANKDGYCSRGWLGRNGRAAVIVFIV